MKSLPRLLALLMATVQMVVATSRSYYPEILKQCLNDNQPAMEVNTWEHAMSDRMSAIRIADAWWSPKPPAVPMTIITQLSVDRLGQLKAQVGGVYC